MKKQKHLILLLLTTVLFTLTNCTKLDLEIEVPVCIEDKIEVLKNAPVQNPPAIVEQWNVDHTTYYYITSDCCDQFNYLYDENCNQVCAPDGGITGKGDGNCPTFNGAVISRLVWEDDRN